MSATLLLTFGVSGLIAPAAGILGDRFDRKRLMILSDLGGAVCFGGDGARTRSGAAARGRFLAAVAESPFWSASGAAVPNLVPEKDLAWANGLLAAGRNAGVMIGPALGGALIHAFGVSWLFAGNGVSFVVSAILVATVRASFSKARGAVEPEEEVKGYRGLRAGFAFLAKDGVLRTILLAWFVFILGVGMAMVADVPLAELFGAGAIGYGLINASWGAGSVLGSLAGRRMSERSEVRYLVFGSIGISFFSLGIALSPWFWLVLALSLVFGLGDGMTMVAEQGIAQRRTPDAVRSRVMAAFDGGTTWRWPARTPWGASWSRRWGRGVRTPWAAWPASSP
ncbi:MAG TPA: MFS transporter [Actinomycetota bacterium]